VDDMLSFGTDLGQVKFTKSFLSQNFNMKDFGEVDVILGIMIRCIDNGLILSQCDYIKKELKRFNNFDCKPISTPFDASLKLEKNIGELVSQLEYARVIGYLMYAMSCTRSNIAFPVSKLSRYTSNPTHMHWHAVGRVLKYVKSSINYGLYYSSHPFVLEGFSYASWITNSKGHSSTSGWIFTLGGGAVYWGSEKQTI